MERTCLNCTSKDMSSYNCVTCKDFSNWEDTKVLFRHAVLKTNLPVAESILESPKIKVHLSREDIARIYKMFKSKAETSNNYDEQTKYHRLTDLFRGYL